MKKTSVITNSECRICHTKNLTPILSLGRSPLANAFVNKEELHKKEKRYPLELYFCTQCFLVQLGHVVPPQLLFDNYVYVSSTSAVFQKHFESYAKRATTLFKLPRGSLVLDIGSNDGILLKPFKQLGMRTLGIEPAKHIAKQANDAGIQTVSEFFSITLAQKLRTTHGPAHIITANNVFAHIHNLYEVVTGVQILLDVEGVFIIEAPYLIDFVQKNLFDTIYHEHLSYLSVRPLQWLFYRFGMHVIHVEHVTSHGGSIRVYVARITAKYKVNPSVIRFTDKEKGMKLHTLYPYKMFGARVKQNKQQLLLLLRSLKKQNKTIVGYGAPAKGNTLLNYFGIDTRYLDYIVDDSPYKQGLYTPGTHIPVVAAEKLAVDQPDYVLILAWNFADSIMKRLEWYKKSGGMFIIPVPSPRII